MQGQVQVSAALYCVFGSHAKWGGLAPDPDKVKDLKDACPPTNVSEVHSFCGFVNYYTSFLQGCSTVLQLLYNLTKNGVKFQWDKSCQAAFQKLKTMLTSDTVLPHFDPTKRIKLACAYGVGAVLSQIEQNGVERPICYASSDHDKGGTKLQPTGARISINNLWNIEIP